jgi:Zn-dependent protease with chaperone function
MEELAARLDTRPPDDIYLVPDVNAWVAEIRRGTRLRRRRVLILGYGLVSASTVGELRAWLAHELAHYAGGDTVIAAMLSRTRRGLYRWHMELEGGLLHAPVAIYAVLFLRITQAIARAQELWADHASVELAGLEPHLESLLRGGRADAIFTRLVSLDVARLLAAGRRPENLYVAFRDAEGGLAEDERAELDAELRAQQTAPFDSHPSVAEREEWARSLELDAPPHAPDERAAVVLLDDVESVELAQTRVLLDRFAEVDALEPIAWDAVADEVVRPILLERAAGARERAGELFGEAAARDDETALRAWLGLLARSSVEELQGEESKGLRAAAAGAMRDFVVGAVSALLTTRAMARGAVIEVRPARGVALLDEGESFDPEALALACAEEPARARELLESL